MITPTDVKPFWTGYNPMCVAEPTTRVVDGRAFPEWLEAELGMQIEWPSETQRNWPSEHCLLYFATSKDGAIKIGRSGKPLFRVRGLNEPAAKRKLKEREGVSAPVCLRLLMSCNNRRQERALHKLLDAERIGKGREWFRGPQVKRLLKSLEKYSIPASELGLVTSFGKFLVRKDPMIPPVKSTGT